MYNRLPIEIIFSFFFWASMIFTITSSFQLIILERLIKRQNPSQVSYSKMTPEDKKSVHKLLIKIAIGLGILVSLMLIRKFFFKGA